MQSIFYAYFYWSPYLFLFTSKYVLFFWGYEMSFLRLSTHFTSYLRLFNTAHFLFDILKFLKIIAQDFSLVSVMALEGVTKRTEHYGYGPGRGHKENRTLRLWPWKGSQREQNTTVMALEGVTKRREHYGYGPGRGHKENRTLRLWPWKGSQREQNITVMALEGVTKRREHYCHVMAHGDEEVGMILSPRWTKII